MHVGLGETCLGYFVITISSHRCGETREAPLKVATERHGALTEPPTAPRCPFQDSLTPDPLTDLSSSLLKRAKERASPASGPHFLA